MSFSITNASPRKFTHVIRTSVCLILIMLSFSVLSAEQFRFKYINGEKYRILSTVEETVHVNGVFSNQSEIINRISVSVTDAAADGTSGTQEAVFMTSENAITNGSSERRFVWGEEYESVFSSDELGYYTIGDQYLMPVVRNEPVFPYYEVNIGDTWEGQGIEVHDMRQAFGSSEPLRVPFDAVYTYKGTIEKDGKTLHIIKAESSIFSDIPFPKGLKGDYPSYMMEFSDRLYTGITKKVPLTHTVRNSASFLRRSPATS